MIDIKREKNLRKENDDHTAEQHLTINQSAAIRRDML